MTLFTERTLIENLIGSLLNSDGDICAKHQYLLGIYWKSSNTCQHPNYKRRKRCTVRTAGYELGQHISKKCNIVFPIWSNICTTHRKQEESDKSVANAEDKSLDSENDPDFTPLEIYLDEEKIEKSNRNITDTADILNASPDRFQLKKKNINDIIRPTKSYLLKRFHAPASLLKMIYMQRL